MMSASSSDSTFRDLLKAEIEMWHSSVPPRAQERSAASDARASASSVASVATARLISQVLASGDSATAARRALRRPKKDRGAFTPEHRRELARLAGMEQAWVDCDQLVPENLSDLVDGIVSELFEPYWFYRKTLKLDDIGHGERTSTIRSRSSAETQRREVGSASSGDCGSPRTLFGARLATRAMVNSSAAKNKKMVKKSAGGFWTAKDGLVEHPWLPGLPPVCEAALGEPFSLATSTFDAVCHFVQGVSGTGVHVGGGLVLTCAHVVHASDDDVDGEGDDKDGGDGSSVPMRVGRKKVWVLTCCKALALDLMVEAFTVPKEA